MSFKHEIPILVLTFGGLLFINFHFIKTPVTIEPIADSHVSTPFMPENGEKAVEIETTSFVQALTRPLFSSGRRPWQQEAMIAVASPETATPPMPMQEPAAISEPSMARLIGIKMTPVEAAALIAADASSNPQWYKSGADFREWKITGIDGNSVSLTNRGKTYKLFLHSQGIAGDSMQ